MYCSHSILLLCEITINAFLSNCIFYRYGQVFQAVNLFGANLFIFAEESVRINWVLRAKVETAKATEKPEGEENGETTSELLIHYIKRHEQPEFRLSLAQVKFSGPTNICTEWETVLTDLLAKNGDYQQQQSKIYMLKP